MTQDNQSSRDIPIKLCTQNTLNLPPAIASFSEDNRLTQAQIKLWIPQNYHREPILSHLISDHGITVNITAAPCTSNLRDDRWFSLELRGKAKQIRSALAYLDKNKLQLFQGSPAQ
jgi:NIL domain